MTAPELVHGIPSGAIVAWDAPVTNIFVGLCSNAAREERIGRVSHAHGEFVVIYDPDGVRALVAPERLTVLAERAEAGWARLGGSR